jgi:hypothetical protein
VRHLTDAFVARVIEVRAWAVVTLCLNLHMRRKYQGIFGQIIPPAR